MGQKNQNWGHPVGKIATLYNLCPELNTPDGAESIVCDQATCAQICNPGYFAKGPRRTKCRYNNKNGKSTKLCAYKFSVSKTFHLTSTVSEETREVF